MTNKKENEFMKKVAEKMTRSGSFTIFFFFADLTCFSMFLYSRDFQNCWPGGSRPGKPCLPPPAFWPYKGPFLSEAKTESEASEASEARIERDF